MSMDTITLTGVSANGKHGVLDFEKQRAQNFVVDTTLYLDLAAAGQSDDLNDTVDYGRVAKQIVAIIEGEHVDLIEKLAADIADAILAIDPIQRVDVTVHKPHAPITVPFADVSVSISRGKADAEPARDAQAASSATTSAGMHHAVVAMGGNMGDVRDTLRDAVRCMDGLTGTQVTGISPLYRTAAWGMADGTPDFFNAVVELETTLGSHELLAALQDIEVSHGRTREQHWGSRTLDLDIIDFDGRVSADPDLALPHPRAWQRAFVLAPWHALAPNARLSGAHAAPVAELLAAAPDRDAVTLDTDDWMLAASALSSPTSSSLSATANDDDLHSRRLIVGLESARPDAERLFRQTIVTLDGIPGTEVQGISPLYHVSHVDSADAMSAVVQVETRIGDAAVLADVLQQTAAPNVTFTVIDPAAGDRKATPAAAVLVPWLDMDPEATYGSDPVSYLLAMNPEASQVGMLSDNWIFSADGEVS